MAIVCMCVRVMICVTKRFSGFYVFTIWRFNRCTAAECVEAPRADLKSQSSSWLMQYYAEDTSRDAIWPDREWVAWKSVMIIRNNR